MKLDDWCPSSGKSYANVLELSRLKIDSEIAGTRKKRETPQCCIV